MAPRLKSGKAIMSPRLQATRVSGTRFLQASFVMSLLGSSCVRWDGVRRAQPAHSANLSLQGPLDYLVSASIQVVSRAHLGMFVHAFSNQ